MATERRANLQAFSPSKTLADQYARQIRGVSREIRRICSILTVGDMSDYEVLRRLGDVRSMLDKYQEIIEPWAESAATETIVKLSMQNRRLWQASGRVVSRQIASGFDDILVNSTIQEQIRRNIALIKNLPVGANKRLGDLVYRASAQGKRAAALAHELLESEGMTFARANLIARTEISKVNTEITRVRALGYDSPGYFWRTSQDGAVRDSHARKEGVFVKWNEPPTLDGMTGHAGEFPNCRCYTEVVMPADEADVQGILRSDAV